MSSEVVPTQTPETPPSPAIIFTREETILLLNLLNAPNTAVNIRSAHVAVRLFATVLDYARAIGIEIKES